MDGGDVDGDGVDEDDCEDEYRDKDEDNTRVTDGDDDEDEDDADGVWLMDGGEPSDRRFFQGNPAKVPHVSLQHNSLRWYLMIIRSQLSKNFDFEQVEGQEQAKS